MRDPSLSDPAWITQIGRRIADNVTALGGRQPLYYSLADEPGIADLAANWDFDFSPNSLDEMRESLKGEYGSLDSLNREWDARFRQWDEVVPETTDEAMRSFRDNFAAWVDFKTWWTSRSRAPLPRDLRLCTPRTRVRCRQSRARKFPAAGAGTTRGSRAPSM